MSIAEKLEQIAENEQTVYEAGSEAERKAFWKNYLNNGTLPNCQYMFSGRGWTDDTFRPPYNITPAGAKQMFCATSISDLKGCLDECGVVLDFSQCNNLQEVFSYASVTHIGAVSTVSAADLSNAFYNATQLHSIDSIVLKSDGTQTFSNTFTYCRALENVTFSGVIGNNISIAYSTKLSNASFESTVNALSDTVTGKTATFAPTAKNNAFTDEEWAALIGTKPNWTFSLV